MSVSLDARVGDARRPLAPASMVVGLRLARALQQRVDTLDALRITAEVLSRELSTPAGVWVYDSARSHLELVSLQGLRISQREPLRGFTRWWALEHDPAGYTRLLVDLFQRATRSPTVTAVDVSCGLLVLGGSHPEIEAARSELVHLLMSERIISLGPADQLELFDPRIMPGSPDERLKMNALTRREREVLGLLIGGAGTQEVSARLGISAKTVKTHVQNILAKLDVRSRLEAVALASRNGVGSSIAS